jgi:hypothetical protein
MAALKISAFAGIAPRVGVALLKDNEAETAINTKLYSGELRSWNKPNEVTGSSNLAVNALSMYKHKDSSGGDLWLSWTTDVNVVPSPIFDTGENPIYFTGSGTPKKTNSSLAETGSAPFPGDYYEMGVPAPTAAPSVSAAGGSGTAESRVYLYTYISTFGTIEEESAPSPASSVLSVLPGGTVTVSGLGTAAPAGDYNITKKRIYRAVSGTSTTIYLKVADVLIGTASYSDTSTATQLGGALESSNYNPPPSDLQGIASMANGILVGFRENEIYFSEPYVPHAWPAEYSLTVEYPIVGIGCYGESVVVATQGSPFVISGSTPLSMSQAKIPLFEPCISKRSIVSDDTGVMYVSPNGIVKISQGFAGVSTSSLFTRDEWQRKKPATMLGAVLDGAYYLFWEDVTLGIERCLILDRNEVASALTETTVHTKAVFVDPTSAQLYFSVNSKVNEWEGNPNSLLPYEWLSKLFIFPRPLNFSALQLEANFEDVDLANALISENAEIIAANQALFASGVDLMGTLNSHVVNGMYVNGSLMAETLDEVSGRFIQLSIYCGGVLVATKQVSDRKTYRLPSGFKSDRWQFKITGNVPLKSIKFAETAKELSQL